MNDPKQRLQLPLFEPESPNWSALSCQAQQRVIAVLSEMLRDAIDDRRDRITTTIASIQDDVHVS